MPKSTEHGGGLWDGRLSVCPQGPSTSNSHQRFVQDAPNCFHPPPQKAAGSVSAGTQPPETSGKFPVSSHNAHKRGRDLPLQERMRIWCGSHDKTDKTPRAVLQKANTALRPTKGDPRQETHERCHLHGAMPPPAAAPRPLGQHRPSTQPGYNPKPPQKPTLCRSCFFQGLREPNPPASPQHCSSFLPDF